MQLVVKFMEISIYQTYNKKMGGYFRIRVFNFVN